MTDRVPPEEQGGDPPCWAEQFADEDGADREPGEPGGSATAEEVDPPG